MTPTCTFEGCTFDTTGICLLQLDPSECRHRLGSETGAGDDDDADSAAIVVVVDDLDPDSTEAASNPLTAAPLSAPPSTRSALPVGRQLKFEHLAAIGSDRSLRMIGILGAPDAGKTAVLVSLYLMASQGQLANFRFLNSDSLFGLDELAKAARDWDENGQMTETITEHTELADPRRPGFVHFRLHSTKSGGAVDLAFPDLPGEWTNTFIETSNHQRLQFMRSAQALWIVVDGSALADVTRRQNAVSRTETLLARVREYLDPPPELPIILVVTRRDEIDALPDQQIQRILDEGKRRGMTLKVVEVSSISGGNAVIPSGHGIAGLLEDSIIIPTLQSSAAARSASGAVSSAVGDRQMLRFRSKA